METKTGMLKLKTSDMNDDSHNKSTVRPVSLNNKSTPDAAVFDRANISPTADAAVATASWGGGGVDEEEKEEGV